MTFTRMIFRTSALPSLLACALFACTSSNDPPATGTGGQGGTTGMAGTTGTAGSAGAAGSSSAGAAGMTGGAGASGGGAAGGSAGQAGTAGSGGAAGTAGNAGTGGGGTVKVYDLKSDWSDAQNPSGPWAVMIGTSVATNLPNWNGETGQNAYVTSASGDGHIPVLLKVTADNFEGDLAQSGDLVVHAQDESGGSGLGQARIVWTAPSSGTVDIDASFWLARTSLKRKDVYTVKVAGAMKGMGDVPYNMGVTRDAPAKFEQKGLPIMMGETVELEISHALTCDACSASPCDGTQGTCAEFCDYLLKVTHTSQ